MAQPTLLYIANYRIPTEKAHGLQVAQMCDAFVEAGASLELILPKRPFIKESIHSYYHLRHEFPVIFLPVWDLTGKIPSIGFFIQSMIFAFQVLRYIRKIRYTGPVLTRDQFSAFILSLFGRNRFYYEAHTIPRRGFPLYRLIFRRAVGIIAISNGLRDALVTRGIQESKILVAHDGLANATLQTTQSDSRSARKSLGLPSERNLILYFGSFIPWKGVDTFLQAASKLPETYFSIAVGGSGEDLRRIESMFRGLAKQCEIRAYVKPDEAQRYYEAADILVVPNSAREDISRLYTSPLKLFEYLATGKPVVVSDVPSLREIAQGYQGVWFFTPDDPGSLAATIRKIPIGSQNTRDLKAYTWDNRAQRIMRLIEK